jgi:hypothetical protein
MGVTQALHERIEQVETVNRAMRDIIIRVAEGRMARDMETMIESCLYCTLKRGGEHGYTGTHAETCIVALARKLGY